MNQAPLNYIQRYILRHLEGNHGSTMFNLAKMFRLKPGIDLTHLAQALAAAGRSHQALLSLMHKYPDGEVLQVQGVDDDEIEVEVVKVRERNLMARRSSYIKKFDIYDEGLVDAIIFECENNAYLLSNIHHLVCDGYSFPLILKDAYRAWNGEKLEKDAYYDVLARRDAKSRMPVAAAARRMMQEVLKSREFVSLPRFDFSHRPGYGSLETELALPGNFDAKLEMWKASRHHFFLACTSLALGKLSDSNDVEVDWVFHGRLTKDELNTVGAFMVDLPFPLMDIREKTPDEVIFDTKHWTFFGIKNAHSIRDNDEDPLGGERLTFVYQDKWGELMSPGKVDPEGPFAWMIDETIPLKAPEMEAENPFNVEIMEHKESTKLFIEYDTGRYSKDTIRNYIECFRESMKWLLG